MAGEGDDDEIIESGTESEGAGGQDAPAGDEDTEVPAEQSDDQADDGEQEVDEPAPKQGRAEGRIQRLANEAKAAREEAAAARREAQEARREAAQRQEQQTEAQQREMLALMTPEERAEWRIQQMERRQSQERQQDRTQHAVMMDKMAYDAKATVNPHYAKFKDEVESRFQEQMRQGRPVEREILLKVLLGERALEGAGKSGQARRQATKRVESQRVSAGSGKGDAPSSRGKAGDTAENRLKGVII